MLISLSYSLGDSTESKDFENFEEMKEFIIKVVEVKQQESVYFDLSIYLGKEEERVRSYKSKELIKKSA